MEAEVFHMPLAWRMRLRKVKDHLNRQKGTYIAGAIAVGIFALMQNQRRNFEGFLQEKGLDANEMYMGPELYKFWNETLKPQIEKD